MGSRVEVGGERGRGDVYVFELDVWERVMQ